MLDLGEEGRNASNIESLLKKKIAMDLYKSFSSNDAEKGYLEKVSLGDPTECQGVRVQDEGTLDQPVDASEILAEAQAHFEAGKPETIDYDCRPLLVQYEYSTAAREKIPEII